MSSVRADARCAALALAFRISETSENPKKARTHASGERKVPGEEAPPSSIRHCQRGPFGDMKNDEVKSEEREVSMSRRKIGEQLKRPSGFHIPTNDDEVRFVHGEHGKESSQARVLAFLHRKWVQNTLVALLLLDVLLLFTELFLAALYPVCHLIERDAISCCPPPDDVRWLASEEDLCQSPLVDTDYDAACDNHKWHTVHTVEEVFFYMTIGILSIFMIELSLLIAALGLREFFRHSFYVLDLVVVSVGLALEVTFHVVDEDDLAAYAGLLVLARCWRLVRVSHGLMEATAEIVSWKYEKVVKLAEELEEALEEYEQESKQRHISIGSSGSSSSTDTSGFDNVRRKNKALIEAIHEAGMEEQTFN